MMALSSKLQDTGITETGQMERDFIVIGGDLSMGWTDKVNHPTILHYTTVSTLKSLEILFDMLPSV